MGTPCLEYDVWKWTRVWKQGYMIWNHIYTCKSAWDRVGWCKLNADTDLQYYSCVHMQVGIYIYILKFPCMYCYLK